MPTLSELMMAILRHFGQLALGADKFYQRETSQVVSRSTHRVSLSDMFASFFPFEVAWWG